MNKRKIAAIMAATVIINFSATSIEVFADEMLRSETSIVKEKSTRATISKFELSNHSNIDAYNQMFKMDNSNIESITNNGGKYGSSTIDKAIDEDFSTHWETGNPNKAEFTNEVVFKLNEITTLNRIVYAARQSSAKGKGFAEEVEIYGSLTDEGDDFTLVSTGEYKGSTGDTVEIKFNPTQFKRIKFKFIKANQDWASASEFMFYKEDKVSEKIKNLFTDDTMSKVNEEFNSIDKLNALEEEVKEHPLYEDYKISLEDAKIILQGNKIEATTAKVSRLEAYHNGKDSEYSELYRMPNDNITNVSANGGVYPTTKLEYMLDDNPDTHWETKTNNNEDFTNEVIFTLDKPEVLNRIAFLARDNRKGFPEEFEIYGSETTNGDTFQLVARGSAKSTNDFLEFKFEPTKFKRIKFKFVKANINRPFVAEFRFYKEDAISDKFDRLFTDNTMSTVSEEFNTTDKINALEEEVKKHPFYEIFKENLENARELLNEQKIEVTTATTRQFEHYSNEEYSNLFKMDNNNIKGIKNNAGQYLSQVITNAIDGNLDTYWETNKGNTSDFTNEVEVEFKEAVEINRIVYGARKSDRKGFAKEFEIYASTTSKGDTYQLVATGSHDKVAGLVEAKFNPTKFKRVKFKFKNSDQNWATLSEIAFYKKDAINDKVDSLFTDATMSTVSEEFNSLEKINALEEEAKKHPLYENFKEHLENARELINQQKLEPTTAKTRQFEHYSNEEYSSLFKMDNNNIKSIRNNAGHYSTAVIINAIDGDLNTYWETNKGNTSEFTNEVEVEFIEAVELNRIVYGARKSDNKGFAKEFEIYGSTTSKGDTYQLVTTGSHNKVSGLVEAKFNPTKFKRVKFKFKNSDQNWATLSEIAFYKQDAISDKVDSLFTNGLMNELSEEFNTIDKLQALENEAKGHPLEDSFKESFEIANKILNGELETVKVIEAEQHGNMVAHANKNLKFGFGNNNQPTGVAAKPGEEIIVYVDADPSEPMPSLAFAQQEGSFANWMRTVNLKPGKNVITVPEVAIDSWYNHDVTRGGSIYIVNPYTPEEQSKAPVIRFASGGEKYPYLTADTDVEEFKNYLIDYKKAIDEDIAENPDVLDRQVLDIFEFVSDHIVWTGTATGAYKAYIEQGANPLDTINRYNNHMKELFKYYGLDGTNEQNDPKYIRENVRLAQPYGYMYAYTNHIGVQGDVMTSLLVGEPGWGLDHEIGHRMDVNARLYGEVTNNMLPMYMSAYYNKIDNRIPYENEVYKNVISENSNKYSEGGLAENLAVFWQLEMYKPGYWGELNKLYRERNVDLGKENPDNVKMQYLVKFSSEVVGEDLSEYFARHGFEVNEETRVETSNYPKLDKKIWYLNNSKANYKGNGFEEDTSLDLSLNRVENGVKLTFNISENAKSDLLGYEIFRDDELIGFTSTNSFIDTNADRTKNSRYEVIPYDLNLGIGKSAVVNSFTPSMSIKQDNMTLSLGEEFDPMDYIKVLDHEGNDITSKVKVTHNVDTSKKGVYEVKYAVSDEGIEVEKVVDVKVVSSYDYASDLQEVSSKVGSGSLTKDKSIRGGTITFLRNGSEFTYNKGIGAHANSEVVYNIEGKGYEYFESYIGVDQWAKNTAASVTFEVWVDGEKKFDSEVFKHDTDSGYARVNVSEAKEVKLITTDAKISGNTYDHSVWADAKFIKNNIKPVINVEEEVSYVKLNSDFDLTSGVTANDREDGNITENIKVNSNNFNIEKSGEYTIIYTITDSDNNITTKDRKVVVYSESDYLSDMEWESAVSGWKTVNKDSAVNSTSKIKLKVNGEIKEFDKGIGAATNAEIVYNLDGNYTNLSTYVGTDKNYDDNRTTIIFKIFADGEEVYTSDVIRRDTEAELVNLDVTGVKELKLVANDADGNGLGDFASWGDTKVYTTNAKPKLTIPTSVSTKLGQEIDLNEEFSAIDAEDGDITEKVEVTGKVNFNKTGKYPITYTVTDNDGNEVVKTRTIAVVDMNDYKYLSDYDWKATQNSYAAPKKDISASGKALRLTNEDGNEVSFERGIGSHATSTITYDLTDKDYGYFSSYVGVDRQMFNSVGSVTFEVYVDGEKKFDSGLMTGKTPMKYVEVDINGAKELKLVVTDGGNGIGSDHATWGDTKLHFAKDVQGNYEELESLVNEANKYVRDDYTEESFKVLEEALNKAEIMLTDKISNQDEINSMVSELNESISKLEEYVDLNEVITIKDEALKDIIKKELNLASDNITIGDMYKLTKLDASSKWISSLEGLGYAKNLESLDVSYNEIKDLSPLKNLKKLTNLNAELQIITEGMLYAKDNKITLDYKVLNRNGERLAPKEIVIRSNRSTEAINLTLDELVDENGVISFEISNFDKYVHSIYLVYEDEQDNFLTQSLYMFDVK